MTIEWLWGFLAGWICCAVAGAIAYLVHRHRANRPEFQTTSQFLEATDHLDLAR
jgi:hypothetical protein